MAYYSYFAYAVMMITLLLAIKYCLEGFYLRNQEQTLGIFKSQLRLLLKLSYIKYIALVVQLCFTVLSIMCFYYIFLTTGDINAMCQAASVGLGTTAIGALIIVVSKLMIDRVLLPHSIENLVKYEFKLRALNSKTNDSKNLTRGTYERIKIPS